MTDQQPTRPIPDPVMTVAGEHAADRLLRSQKLYSEVYLHGEEPPTPQQVAAVLHALADHTLLAHLVGPDVAELGRDRAHLGDGWAQASGIGRFLQRMGDWLEGAPAPR
ncbi:MAG TPA: hypothetical protein VI452_12925 [Marmoricola sp.]